MKWKWHNNQDGVLTLYVKEKWKLKMRKDIEYYFLETRIIWYVIDIDKILAGNLKIYSDRHKVYFIMFVTIIMLLNI